MDERDSKIIAILRENSRATVKQIGKKSGIRPSTVHQRIKKLIKNGIIEKFTIKLDNKKVQENFIVFVLIKTKTQLGRNILSDKLVKEVFGITGQYDVMLKLKCKDIDEFNTFILKLRKIHGITDTVTMVSTKTIKEEL